MIHPDALFESTSEAAVVADLASKAAEPAQITIVDDRLVGVVVNGQLTTFDLDKYRDNPVRAIGASTLTDQDSFVELVNRYSDQTATTVWSDVNAGTFTAVLDDHGRTSEDAGGLPGHGTHRSTLRLQNSPDWEHWLKLDNKMVDQSTFAEHIEDGAGNIVKPEAAAMLELAQSFQANTRVDFESADRLDSGAVNLVFKETVAARAGHTGQIEIPTMIELNLQVFEGGAVYALKARFKYRIDNGRLTLGYRLIRPDVARKLAFDDVSAVVSDGLGLPILAGTPRS